MAQKFAKLFERKDGSQILVTLVEDHRDRPSIKYQFTPPKLGVCEMSINFNPDDDGWGDADKTFEEITQESAESVVDRLLSNIHT